MEPVQCSYLIYLIAHILNCIWYIARQASIILMRQVERGQVEGMAVAYARCQVLCDLYQHTLSVPLIHNFISFGPSGQEQNSTSNMQARSGNMQKREPLCQGKGGKVQAHLQVCNCVLGLLQKSMLRIQGQLLISASH